MIDKPQDVQTWRAFYALQGTPEGRIVLAYLDGQMGKQMRLGMQADDDRVVHRLQGCVQTLEKIHDIVKESEAHVRPAAIGRPARAV